MSERKVINRYYPPDYDPVKGNRTKHGSGHKKTVRLMAPYSMRCNSCGEFIYKGKKFNARKEIVQGEDYYGIPIYRFYIKCTRCSAEIIFRTDPKNTDYAAEDGATRNFEPWRENDGPRKEENRITVIDSDEEEEEEVDPMKALEQRTIESQREMEIMDALQDIRTRNARHERVDADTVLQSVSLGKRKVPEAAHDTTERSQEEEEDEALVKKYFGKRHDARNGSAGETNGTEEAKPNGTQFVKPNDPEDAAPNGSDAKPTPTKKQKAPEAAEEVVESVPDATSLLSDATRAHLQSLAKPANTMPKPVAKKRRGPNALGLVRK
ncbi:Pre-mRNA-splicing factor cwf16 [Malassezia japonica]|uniref:Splicing factor YJU2 n=1 Tax=Malassezia japonica TaxID=223818 RepID=A0AAF0J8K7_9BASI|nr:Pre-mRNA-splicing factor cwf16 [Malassezia japonica]WFD37393.1 Pre-mRNA-splicing factor cwf16 [Malassezia japonica]